MLPSVERKKLPQARSAIGAGYPLGNELKRDLAMSRGQFSLRTIFVVTSIVALGLCVLRVGGIPAVATAAFLGLAVGGAISILGRNKRGATPLVIMAAALAASLIGMIFGIVQFRLDVQTQDNPFGKGPSGPEPAWFAFVAAILIASCTAFSRLNATQPAEDVAESPSDPD